MDPIKSFSRRCLAWLLGLNLVLFAVICAAVYFAFYASAQDSVFLWSSSVFFSAAGGLFFLMALIQWGILRASFKRLTSGRSQTPESGAERRASGIQKKKETGEPALSDRQIQRQNKRYYLHLLSVLQRRGRLLDFLKEDLNAYSDEQIGAAVRSVHENCIEVIEKYLAPAVIIDKAEGGQVTIDSDFDPSAIKITGNVIGEPPFSGVLRHPGWRAGKVDLPVFADSGDPDIIFPAEIEVS
ncbi:MAG: DUF2760 domain-containing protein [Desulfobacterales bacterium]